MTATENVFYGKDSEGFIGWCGNSV